MGLGLIEFLNYSLFFKTLGELYKNGELKIKLIPSF